MANTTTNHSDLPCSCSTLEAYVDGLCPGCIEAADRDADLKEHLDAQSTDTEDDSDRYGEDGKGYDHPEFDD
jgi:hypothetical protein